MCEVQAFTFVHKKFEWFEYIRVEFISLWGEQDRKQSFTINFDLVAQFARKC